MTSRKNPLSSAWVMSCLTSTPCNICCDSVLVGAACANEVIDRVIGVDGFACVTPEALDDVVLHLVLGAVMIVHVRDLHLAASGGLKSLDRVEDRIVVEIHACDRQRTWRVTWLFDDPANAIAIIALGTPKVPEMTPVIELREQDAGTRPLVHERLDSGPQ